MPGAHCRPGLTRQELDATQHFSVGTGFLRRLSVSMIESRQALCRCPSALTGLRDAWRGAPSVARKMLRAMAQVATPRTQPVLLRAAVWSLVGMIYAPLYLVLEALLRPSLAAFAGPAAAGIAGGVGAAFYGARQLALTASLIGTGAATLTMSAAAPAWLPSVAAVLVSIALGFLLRFPQRCTADVGVKVLAGLGMGTLAGTALLAADRLAGVLLPVPAVLAFLVSVTGVLYVGVLVARPLRAPTRGRFCDLSEGLVMAVIALVTANGLAGFTGIFADGEAGRLTTVLLQVSPQLPAALLAAMLAGAMAGGLLELFEFDWVDRA